MVETTRASLDTAWTALWADLRRNATGEPSGNIIIAIIIAAHRPTIERLATLDAERSRVVDLRALAIEIAKDWNGRVVTGADILRAIDTVTSSTSPSTIASLTNPRLADIEWDEVAAVLALPSEEAHRG